MSDRPHPHLIRPSLWPLSKNTSIDLIGPETNKPSISHNTRRQKQSWWYLFKSFRNPSILSCLYSWPSYGSCWRKHRQLFSFSQGRYWIALYDGWLW